MEVRLSVMRTKWYPIVTGILSLAALSVNLTLIRILMGSFGDSASPEALSQHIDYPALRPFGTLLFLILTVFHLVQCVSIRRESRLLFFKHLIYILLSALSCVLFIINGDDSEVWPYACFFYLLAVFIGCVISFLHKRSKWHILLFVLMLVVIFLGACSVLLVRVGEMNERAMASMFSIMLVFFMVDIQAVASIIPLAFSSIRMDILRKIIKKTYAVEILSGIVLLIVAFSFILPAFEPSISNFQDALWYCFAIVTTIGFGDITAVSAIGRILSVILGIYGIIVVSLITSIIVNFYGEMKKEEGFDDDPPEGRSAGRREPVEEPPGLEEPYGTKPVRKERTPRTPRGRRGRVRRTSDKASERYEVITEEIEL